jgi:hypothetical protein
VLTLTAVLLLAARVHVVVVVDAAPHHPRLRADVISALQRATDVKP